MSRATEELAEAERQRQVAEARALDELKHRAEQYRRDGKTPETAPAEHEQLYSEIRQWIGVDEADYFDQCFELPYLNVKGVPFPLNHREKGMVETIWVIGMVLLALVSLGCTVLVLWFWPNTWMPLVSIAACLIAVLVARPDLAVVRMMARAIIRPSAEEIDRRQECNRQYRKIVEARELAEQEAADQAARVARVIRLQGAGTDQPAPNAADVDKVPPAPPEPDAQSTDASGADRASLN